MTIRTTAGALVGAWTLVSAAEAARVCWSDEQIRRDFFASRAWQQALVVTLLPIAVTEHACGAVLDAVERAATTPQQPSGREGPTPTEAY